MLLCAVRHKTKTQALLHDYLGTCGLYRLSTCTFHGPLFFCAKLGLPRKDHYHHWMTLGFGKCQHAKQEEPHFDFAPW